MTKIVTIIITGSDEDAVIQTAENIVNTTNKSADWVNTNHPGGVDLIKATTQAVTVVKTDSTFVKNSSGVLAPQK